MEICSVESVQFKAVLEESRHPCIWGVNKLTSTTLTLNMTPVRAARRPPHAGAQTHLETHK